MRAVRMSIRRGGWGRPTDRPTESGARSNTREGVQQTTHLAKLPNQHVPSSVVLIIVWANSKVVYKPRDEQEDPHDERPDFDAEPGAKRGQTRHCGPHPSYSWTEGPTGQASRYLSHPYDTKRALRTENITGFLSYRSLSSSTWITSRGAGS